MKYSLKGLCATGVLLLPLAAGAAPVVRDISQGSGNFYENTQAQAPSAGASLQILNQLQEHERELQELRGQIEELRYQLDQQQQLAQERYLELEKRQSQGGARTATEDSQAVGSSGSGDQSDKAQRAYQAAFQKVQSREFDAAIGDFEAFVDDYPQSPLRANAYYWLGELHSSRSELEPAAQAFQTVIDDYPQSSKKPDALYKLGLLKARQGQPDDSKALMKRLREEYPDSNAASMAADFLNQSGL